MPGLVPGIQFLSAATKVVDGRDKPGHDAVEARTQSPDVPLPETITPYNFR
ncbi:hypothetical protein [Bradyrhizobium sp. 25ACV]